MIVLLSLDLGKSMGWALARSSGSKSFSVNTTRKNCPETQGLGWDRFCHWLTDLIEREGVTHIVFEDVHRHVGTKAAHFYGALKGIMELVCHRKEVALLPVGVNTWKKGTIGAGNATKDDSTSKARALRGIEPSTHDEADAVCIWHYGAQALGVEVVR